MGLFRGTARYYAQFRPGIPASVAALLVTESNRKAPATTLLDLGTGTGQIVEALAGSFQEIVAVDPDAEMLEVAKSG